MSDRRLRSLEQAAMSGDPEAQHALIVEKSRLGILPSEHIKFAAHLGDELAQSLVLPTPYIVQCGSCNGKGQSYCYACKGTGRTQVDEGLVASIRMVCPSDIPLRLIGEWSCDCVARVLSACEERSGYPQLVPRIVEEVRKWLSDMNSTSAILQGLQADNRTSRGLTDFFVVALGELVGATARRSDAASAGRFAQAVSFAYHATGHQRSERDWQIQHLVRLLLL